MRVFGMIPYRQVWLNHIRSNEVIAFPRDYNLYRRKLLSEKQYLTSCQHAHDNKLEMFTSVYGEYEMNNHIITTFFYDIDIDHAGIDSVYELIARSENLISKTRVIYTGHRGIHVYVDIHPTRVQDLRQASEFVAELLGIRDIVDKQVLGDWKRMCRVPGSFHKKTGEESIVINPITDSELKKLLTDIIRARYGSKSVREFKVNIPPPVKETVTILGEPPACVLYLLGKLFVGQDLSHQARIHLGVYLLHLGLTPEEASVLFATQSDFNPEYTLYQLRWLQERNYKMYSCMRARELGLCPLPLQHCKYYPSANWWF